jgi:hypothetical protein
MLDNAEPVFFTPGEEASVPIGEEARRLPERVWTKRTFSNP